MTKEQGGSHTPGPWGDGHEAICVKVDRERPWASTVFCKNHDGSEANALVAMTFGLTVDEAVANAVLTAAAPELLEALEGLFDLFLEVRRRGGFTEETIESWPEVKAVRAAILNARPEPSQPPYKEN